MDDATGASLQKKSPVQEILDKAKQVILSPVEFYRGMARTGGLVDPLVFVLVLGVASGVIQAVLSLILFRGVMSVGAALGAVIMMPVLVVIGSFIGAAILFVIWKLMGSAENFEVAYRCGAYAAAISPITTVVALVPYVGGLVGLAWGLYLMVTASVEVHKIEAKKAWMVFGIIAAVLALFSLGGAMTSRKIQRDMGQWQQEMGVKPGQAMSRDEAMALAKAMQEKAMREMEKAKAEAEKESAE